MDRVCIEISESAIVDLQEIRAWYEEQHAAEVGERLVAQVLDRVESLAENPELGRMVPEFEQNWLRELIHPPFRIIYKREPDAVQVVRVWRSERLLTMPEQE